MKTKRYSYSRFGMYTRIEQALQRIKLLPGKCLLVGDTLYGKGGGCAIIDMLPKGTEVIAPDYPEVDIHKTPYKDNEFDFVVADQVFEHVRKPWVASKEIYRVLKPKGVAIITSALIYKVHGVPNDFWRFTPEGLKVLFEDFSEIIEVRGTGDRAFAIDILSGRSGVVTKGSDLERRALSCDNIHLVSVWIIAQK